MWKKLIITISISELAGIIGSLFTMPAIPTWYAELTKPELTPPPWIFGPVWITLFALMGIAASLIWHKGFKRTDVKIALGFFLGQLILNTLWSLIFFSLHSPQFAFVEIIFLWSTILITLIFFAKISKPAAWLLIPYLLWVSFAGYLNYSIWQLNEHQNIQDLTLNTRYILPEEWPPQVEVKIAQFLCAEPLRDINGRGYCVSVENDAAAGSRYTTYTYNTEKNERMVTVRFTLRYLQCANFNDPEKGACEEEQQNFDVNQMVDRIIQNTPTI